jgi:glutamate synthase (NADPH/NADH) small chain
MHADESVAEAAWIAGLGDVEIRYEASIGGEMAASSLLKDFDAVFVGLGLGEDTRLGIPGEEGVGVIGATEWIERMKLESNPGAGSGWSFGKVVIVGGGNTAVDVARECAQLGAKEVTMVYRRGPESMSAYAHEMDHARKEGVRVMHHVQPIAVVRDQTKRVSFLQMSNGEGGVVDLPADLIVVAIGQLRLRALARELPGVALDSRGCIIADSATSQTGKPKVYAGGDCVNGGKEVVNAVAEGRNAARAMNAAFARAEPRSKD